ncbi:MAG: UDP-N-acetylmuramoyl-L-alanine--D-glutamate ligase [Firmicutes bacterium]|nr:UDP-N-acetylmuramoyl-L-alanine--D-glutamate ligase [Bacillota bacterium]
MSANEARSNVLRSGARWGSDFTSRYNAVVERLRGKSVVVVGVGVSNLPVIRFLAGAGAKVTACDRKTGEELGATLEKLSGLPVGFRLGPDYLEGLDKFDMMFLTPGIPRDIPQIAAARAAGVTESSEIQLFFELCPAPIVGITGSDGKTTTTTLVGKALEASGKRVFVGGNIGNPLLEQVEHMTPDAVVVLELSSFQLQAMEMSPHIGVILNIYPNHMDYHRSMQEYIDAKANIVSHQRPQDFAVLNQDNEAVRGIGERCRSRRIFFTRLAEPGEGVFVRGEEIWIRLGAREEVACLKSDIRVPGEHNVENVLAVTAVAGLLGVESGVLRDVLREFKGVEHRLELVGELGGVRFYNDSIATTPSRAIAGLRAFEEPLILIAGGYDKKLPFDEFAEVVLDRVKVLVLVGDTAGQIEAAVQRAAGSRAGARARAGAGVEAADRGFRDISSPKIVRCRDFDEAVLCAVRSAAPGDIVLLSPACASFDMFKDYKERGRRFKEIVSSLS